ncbi:MAG: Holliday junction branch migration protein RuvA [Desulfovibrionaceae bacterium]|nr:Holliday junction branch migration protein RuvA [Desulfovibrionaceae bacterium]
MIGYIRGDLHSYTENTCIIETSGGVGYELYVMNATIRVLREQQAPIGLYVCTIVREDALLLFGFLTQEVKQMFILLTGISKVGAKTALAILELFSIQDMYAIVAQNDIARLSSVPGIGKKTAQHIILELQYKLRSIPHVEQSTQQLDMIENSVYGEAKEALLSLGYEETLVHTTLSHVITSNPSIEVSSLIKKALHSLAL